MREIGVIPSIKETYTVQVEAHEKGICRLWCLRT